MYRRKLNNPFDLLFHVSQKTAQPIRSSVPCLAANKTTDSIFCSMSRSKLHSRFDLLFHVSQQTNKRFDVLFHVSQQTKKGFDLLFQYV
jgi:hypothetical protein